MLLTVDIGNSSINAGLFNNDIVIGELRFPSRPAKTIRSYREKIHDFLLKNDAALPIEGVIISSVVPELTGKLTASVKDLTINKPMILDASLKTGLKFGVERPEEIGSDRICGAAAAAEIYGRTVVVVDFGTATTLTAVNKGKYAGGAILPGIKLMGKALHKGTSRLPYVDIRLETHASRIFAAGKNTAACISSGIIYGTAGAVERLIKEMESEHDCKFEVVITGGYSGIMTRFLRRRHHLDPGLTLKGLRLIYERNI